MKKRCFVFFVFFQETTVELVKNELSELNSALGLGFKSYFRGKPCIKHEK